MKIEIVSSDSGDWEALYINDELILEAHSIAASEVLYAIQNYFPHTFVRSFISDERAEEGFPLSRKALDDYLVD